MYGGSMEKLDKLYECIFGDYRPPCKSIYSGDFMIHMNKIAKMEKKNVAVEIMKRALKEIMRDILDIAEPKLNLDTTPSIILVVGVNGVGKTTSIGKIANNLVKQGKKVVVAAADTFRAAAVEQLDIWAQRSGSIIVKKEEGSDPASVVFDAIHKTNELGADVLIVDTAGRLHNKKYLMDELFKINKVSGINVIFIHRKYINTILSIN